jgi:hypothetical protein
MFGAPHSIFRKFWGCHLPDVLRALFVLIDERLILTAVKAHVK